GSSFQSGLCFGGPLVGSGFCMTVAVPVLLSAIAVRSVWVRCLQFGLCFRRGPGTLVGKNRLVIFGSRLLDHRRGVFQRDRSHAELARALLDLGLCTASLEPGRYSPNRFFGVLCPLHRDVVVSQIGFNLALSLGCCLKDAL